jgi:AcrR family transcriptional regulator
MRTHEHILDVAISLFNEEGILNVGLNRIATEAGVSRGHLHYYFNTKTELFRAIFDRINGEMEQLWYQDHKQRSYSHMRQMFMRQMDLMYRYRCFYSEVRALVLHDELLRSRYLNNRRRRAEHIQLYFQGLIDRSVMAEPKFGNGLSDCVKMGMLICDNWFSNLQLEGRPLEENEFEEGYQLVCRIFDPWIISDVERRSAQAARNRGAKSTGTLEPVPVPARK